MHTGLEGLSEDALVSWIENSLATRTHVLAQGYQGRVFLYDDGVRRLIVKTASGAGLARWLRVRMLRNEYKVYRRLEGFPGSPRCYGLRRGRYLVLEYVAGAPLKRVAPADPAAFFDTLLTYIKELHARGVAHADLKRKDNLLVVDGRRPCLVDFGAAIVFNPGFAPLNHFLFRLAHQFDFNAWIKLKYGGRLENISEQDRPYYHRTRTEKIARALRPAYMKLRHHLRRLFSRS